ncbi:MAG: tetratricopeptide repeat protein, partial [Cyanobacteria bacterium]|nr:tetratricopeptide repeat protein [Cyanobacteriota bacterium]MDW8201803.1 tetratricopeptide repeat protein [Cyanobacteriota bacterium SKYGB_h_bin112]
MLAQAVDDRVTGQMIETLHQELGQLSSRCDGLHDQIQALTARTEVPTPSNDEVQAAIAAQVVSVQQDLTQRLEHLQATIATLQTDVSALRALVQSSDSQSDNYTEQPLDTEDSLKEADVLLSVQPIRSVEGAGEPVQTATIVAVGTTTPQLSGSRGSRVPLSTDASQDVATITVPVLAPTHRHPQRQHHMIAALTAAQERVVVAGNWFGSQGFDERLCRQVQAALNRGIIIELDCVGLINADQLAIPKRIHHHHLVQPHHELVTGLHRLLELQRVYPQNLMLRALGLQDWFIVCDRQYAVLPTPSHLQHPNGSDESHQVQISDPAVVHSLLAQFEQPLADLVTARAYSMRAAVHYELGDHDRALADYADALQLNPYDAVTYNNRGVIYYDLGDMRRALADFDQALTLDAHNAEIYANRGTVRAELGDRRGAIADYTCALERHPTDHITYNHRGLLRSRLGDRQGAIADYTAAIHLRPNDDVAYFNRGAARASLGDYEGAIADYSQAIRINPYFANAYNNRGFAQQKLGDWDAAIADFTQAIRISPNFVNAYNNRGITRSKLGDFQGAIADFDHVIRINPDFANAYNNRGTVLSKLGDMTGAIADFNRAVDINPDFANAYNNRGLAYAELGTIDAAIDDLMKASRLFARQGDETSSQQALQKLKMLNQIKSGAGL